MRKIITCESSMLEILFKNVITVRHVFLVGNFHRSLRHFSVGVIFVSAIDVLLRKATTFHAKTSRELLDLLAAFLSAIDDSSSRHFPVFQSTSVR